MVVGRWGHSQDLCIWAHPLMPVLLLWAASQPKLQNCLLLPMQVLKMETERWKQSCQSCELLGEPINSSPGEATPKFTIKEKQTGSLGTGCEEGPVGTVWESLVIGGARGSQSTGGGGGVWRVSFLVFYPTTTDIFQYFPNDLHGPHGVSTCDCPKWLSLHYAIHTWPLPVLWSQPTSTGGLW